MFSGKMAELKPVEVSNSIITSGVCDRYEVIDLENRHKTHNK